MSKRVHMIITWPNLDEAVDWFGGKAEGLLSLIRVEVPVPDFFCVRLGQQDDSSREGVARMEMNAALHRLGPPPWIVRSSANGEDGLTHSYAGIFKSIVIASEESILIGFNKCQESLKGKRVRAYCDAKNIKPPTEMCVIVQRFVEASAAGVAFSRHPVLSDVDSVWIEGNYGVGSSVVDGVVTPDRWVVQKDDQDMTRFTMGTKRIMDVYKGGKIMRIPTTKEERLRPCLFEAQVNLIANLVNKVQSSLGFHIDAEWVWDGGTSGIFIVQVRPITTSAIHEVPNER